MSVPSLTRFRRCFCCGITYPVQAIYFHKDKKAKYGLSYRCKRCATLKANAYNKLHPEKAKDRFKRWKEANPERAKEILQDHIDRDPERYRKLGRERARKRTALKPPSWSWQEVAQMYHDQNGVCAYCESPLFTDFHVEHMIPLSRGGANDWTNIAISCPSCNLRKADKTVEEFLP